MAKAETPGQQGADMFPVNFVYNQPRSRASRCGRSAGFTETVDPPQKYAYRAGIKLLGLKTHS